MIGPIGSAKNIPLSQQVGTLPNVSAALADWFQNIYAVIITKATINYQLVETKLNVEFYGVRQPFSMQELQMLPRGQRQWKWEWLHCYPNVRMEVDFQVVFNDTTYRVMGKKDYAEYGYVEYKLVEDYGQC